MSNMSYCRFRNTLPDLLDCYKAMDDQPDDPEEATAWLGIIKLAVKIAEEYGHLVEEG